VQDIERAKWDGMATRARPEQSLLVQDADFGAYCRRSATIRPLCRYVVMRMVKQRRGGRTTPLTRW
jgi:hypothetical protein